MFHSIWILVALFEFTYSIVNCPSSDVVSIGSPGDLYQCRCTAATTNVVDSIWGSDVFTGDSSPCLVAVFNFVFNKGDSGDMWVKRLPGGSDAYAGPHTRNGVSVSSYGPYSSSFWIGCQHNASNILLGEMVGCYCTTDMTSSNEPIYGTMPFSQESHICRAAVFWGLVPEGGEGFIRLYKTPGNASYPGGSSNNVVSSASGSSSGSFNFAEALNSTGITGVKVTCFNVDANDTINTCSGHGTCISFDSCTCETGYTGYNCNKSYWEIEKDGGLDQDRVFECSTPSATPGSRSSGMAYVDPIFSKFWIFGGLIKTTIESHYEIFNDVWKFDSKSDRWCFVHGNKSTNISKSVALEILTYDEKNYPSSRCCGGLFSSPFASFIVFGGWEYSGQFTNNDEPITTSTNEIWEFDIRKEQWRIIRNFDGDDTNPNFPSPRHYFSYTMDMASRKGYFYGGMKNNETSLLNELWEYDIMNDKFVKLHFSDNNTVDQYVKYPQNVGEFDALNTPFQRSHSNLWFGRRDRHVYLFGGLVQNGTSFLTSYFYANDVWIWNTTKSMWALLNSHSIQNLENTENKLSSSSSHWFDTNNVPCGRIGSLYFMQINTNQDRITLFGGAATNRKHFGGVWEYSISRKLWRLSNSTVESHLSLDSEKSVISSSKNSLFPGARSFVLFASDQKTQKVYIYGGEVTKGS